MADYKNTRFAYVTENGKIPGYTANSVGVMKMCAHISKLGVDVHLFIPEHQHIKTEQDPWSFYNVPQSFQIHYIKTPAFLGPFRIGIFYLKALFNILKLRINHVNSRSMIFSCLSALAEKKTVFESHNYAKFKRSAFRFLWLPLVKSNLFNAKMIVTTQIGKKSYLTENISEEKIIVLPNGAELEDFDAKRAQDWKAAHGLPSDKTLFGFSGSLYPGRGIDEILLSAKNLPEANFLIVGGQPHEIERYTNNPDFGSLDNVTFTGHVTQDKVPEYLMAADILIIPYTSTTAHPYMSPMKMFDYIAAGKPIITTDFPVIREILTEDENALYFEPDSAEALQKALEDILAKPEKQAEMVSNNLKLAQDYSWKKRAAKMMAFHCQDKNKD